MRNKMWPNAPNQSYPYVQDLPLCASHMVRQVVRGWSNKTQISQRRYKNKYASTLFNILLLLLVYMWTVSHNIQSKCLQRCTLGWGVAHITSHQQFNGMWVRSHHPSHACSQAHINKGERHTSDTQAMYTECLWMLSHRFPLRRSFLCRLMPSPLTERAHMKNSILSAAVTPQPRLIFPLFTRRPRRRGGTCCFGPRRVREGRPSSALRPAGPAGWVPESKDGDPGPARTIHP